MTETAKLKFDLCLFGYISAAEGDNVEVVEINGETATVKVPYYDTVIRDWDDFETELHVSWLDIATPSNQEEQP